MAPTRVYTAVKGSWCIPTNFLLGTVIRRGIACQYKNPTIYLFVEQFTAIIVPVAKPPRPESALELGEALPGEEIGYWRVSTQRDQTPDMQIAALKRRGIPDENIFGDMASGRKAKRPQLQLARKLLADRDGWTLVIWKLDRLGRDTMELFKIAKELEEDGVNLVSITEAIDTKTAMGRAFFGMLAVFAQFESDVTKERTAAGMARAKENRSQVGRVPKLSPAQFEQMEKLILSDRAHKLSLGRIAHRFRVSTALVNLYFPGWRSKTPTERKKHRRENPLPSNYPKK